MLFILRIFMKLQMTLGVMTILCMPVMQSSMVADRVANQSREELIVQKLHELIKIKESNAQESEKKLTPEELKNIFGYPNHMVVLSEANKIIDRLQGLNTIPSSYITSISIFLKNHLSVVRVADTNAIINEYFRVGKVENAF